MAPHTPQRSEPSRGTRDGTRRTDWQGSYLDGRSAARRPATIRLARAGLELAIEGQGTAWWPYSEIRQTQGFYEGEQVRLERGGELPEVLLVADPAFLASLHEVGADVAGRFHDPRRRRARVVLTVVAAVAAVGFAAVLYRWGIPVLAAVVAARVPVAWEERLGASIVKQVAPKATRCTDPAGQRVIDAMVATLARGPAKPLYTFRVIVVDDATVNAFAVPGGHVIVLRGLLERARSPEELAGVLAHELQHVLHRHATRALVEQASTGLLVAALVGDASGLLAFAAETARTLGTLRYSRAHEEEADLEGMRMLLAARVDPAGMIAFFERMRGEGKDPPPALTYLSTHPPTEDRILRLRALARAATSPSVRLSDDDDWRTLRAMCPSTKRPGGNQP